MIKQKTKIVIASVLKPVDDVRNYEKIGNTLAKEKHFEVHLVGAKGNSPSDKVQFHEWPRFNRLSFSRFGIQFKYWKKLKELKPELLIVTTHELLLISVFHKLIFGCKIIYDIQEDYFKNLWHQHFYPPVLRHTAAFGIRAIELMSSPFISKFLLAEKTYQKDIGFASKRSAVLDNRSLEITTKVKEDSLKVVFTGTISHYSKVIESIQLFLELQREIPEAEMTVIGYCPKPSYQEKLTQNFEDRVTLKLSDQPVPHQEIINEISSSNLAIIGYQPDHVNRDKMPTKLFEYVVAQLPFLVQQNTLWADEGLRLGGAIPVDFKQPDFSQIRSQISEWQKKKFRTAECLWSNNEPELLDSIASILN